MNLPQEYITELQDILGDELEKYLESFNYPRTYGVRFNTLKVDDVDNLISKFNLNFSEKISWTSNGYYYDEDYRPGKEAAYYAGLYYMQDPSAMAPAEILPVNPGDIVLDMCAAPGGKSTELVSKLNGQGILFSNDMSTSRCKALLKNLEIWGSRNIVVTSEDGTNLSKHFPNYFDKILIDAPCSGEGMFRKEAKMVSAWKEHGPEVFAPIQKELLSNAVTMLKPGGYIVYSTCTYSPMEDEEVLSFILDKYDELELVPFKKIKGEFKGDIKYATLGDQITNTVKFFAHRLKGEGQFVSLIHKKNNSNDNSDNCENIVSKKSDHQKDNVLTLNTHKSLAEYLKNNKDKHITNEAREFLSSLNFNVNENEEIVVRGDNIFLQNKSVINLNNLRILRNGLLLGTIKTKRFEPSQALAMALNENSFSNTLKLNVEDKRVLKYLKGETIEYDENINNGYVLICYDKYPLGFGKANNGIIKNKYLSGWRYN